MREALRLAEATGRMGNIPVGAVVVYEDRIIARAANLRDTLQDPTAHAELLALRAAARQLGSWRLSGAALYVSLEPCLMCAGALVQARLGELVFAAREPKAGAVESRRRLLEASPVSVSEGLCAPESRALLERFFAELRRTRRAPPDEERWPSG